MYAMSELPKPVRKRMEKEIAIRIAEAQKELDEKVEQIRKEEREYTLRRFLKVLAITYCYKWGHEPEEFPDALADFMSFFDENDNDEYLWEHLDRVVMDQLGLFEGWERDYSDEY